MREADDLRDRRTPLEIAPDEFRMLGRALVERIARHLETIRDRPVTPGEAPDDVRRLLGSERGLPQTGENVGALLDEAARILMEHSLFNAHPRFWGYITSSPAPLGILGDFLASAVNANVGSWKLAPVATEIEAQTVRWIAELVGYPVDSGGLLTSGGNMANFVGFLAARRYEAGPAIRREGLATLRGERLLAYGSSETHTWIQKAADLFGHGTDSIRWIPTQAGGSMDVDALRRRVDSDRATGDRPFIVVGNAGSVGTGAVDPLFELAAFCRESRLWFHVDGAYGALAAGVPGAPDRLAGLAHADSVAVDPHKWLYAPLEAGCVLVRREEDLRRTFSYQPDYYHFEEEALNYFDLGMQNSRGFRALKVWLALRQVGREGYRRMIEDDIRLASHLFEILDRRPDFDALTRNLGITTFRYRPPDLARSTDPAIEARLDSLNREILGRIESGGEAFVSNAIVDGRFALRACIVNFRSCRTDVEFLVELVARLGRECGPQPD